MDTKIVKKWELGRRKEELIDFVELVSSYATHKVFEKV